MGRSSQSELDRMMEDGWMDSEWQSAVSSRKLVAWISHTLFVSLRLPLFIMAREAKRQNRSGRNVSRSKQQHNS